MKTKIRKLLTHEEQERYLLSCIGNVSEFKYPADEGKRKGKLIDRVIHFSGEDEKVVYWNIIDCIRFEGFGTGHVTEGNDEDWFRISYYRYRKSTRSWNFAGQTSITATHKGWVELLKVGKEKDWFKRILNEV